MWLSLVERYVRDVEVASSNLVISTKKEKTPTGCLFFFDYDYDFNLQYYARATKLYHRALCLERERARWAIKRARQGNKQGVAQPIGRDTTMFMTERGRRRYLVISTISSVHNGFELWTLTFLYQNL